MKSYLVTRLPRPFRFNAQWTKPPWEDIPPLFLDHHMGPMPAHIPRTRARIAYDHLAIFLIFEVQDRYVCARKLAYQDRVCEDSCVEFFFTPGEDLSTGYFNLEVNCGGTATFYHQKGRGLADQAVSKADFDQVRISHTLPQIVDPEIPTPLTWVLAYRLPFSILAKYAPLVQPATGVSWRANLYKCADSCSHPHWLTWSPVDLPAPDFHQPAFFGRLDFA
jgi:hypothetical protein